jgi:phenylalanyl-tRNA synthetase alpha chain
MQNNQGHMHLSTATIREIYSIFKGMGFEIASGPELETEFYNFDALNVPADHPARDMQDTFWIDSKDRKVLRTQTSSVQVRYMEKHAPPFKMIAPGKVFRSEATDATHEAQFFQVEGLYVSMADLKSALNYFFKKFFGNDVKIRFRPSYFPFTEPSVEVDVWFNGKWLEVMGAGLVHPEVLKKVGIDSKKYSGFAFGGGIERFMMIKHGITDIRLFYSNDLRFSTQF